MRTADHRRVLGQDLGFVMGALRGYVEYEKVLNTQIERAVDVADQGKFASNDQVAAMRARRWSRDAG
nr:hypothetical protein [Pseudomonas sp. FW300-N2E2]